MGKTLVKQYDIYNYWTVISEKPEKINGTSKWLCRCKCGTERYVPAAALRNGSSKSCGCYSREAASLRNRNNLEGQRFGHLIVVGDSGQRYKWETGSNILWECLCDCGNIILVKTSDLTQNKKTHCGCLELKGKQYNGNYKDLTGQKFGHLEVLYDSNIRKSNHVYWHCKCDCGQELDVSSTHLLTGETISCGCLKISKGEDKIINLLKNLNIDFIYQKTYNDCRNPKNNAILYFDFYLPTYNILIEYDGEQHFKSNLSWFNENNVKEIQYRDSIKNDYCCENNIPLIRISDTDFNKLNEEYLLSLIKRNKNNEI